MTRIRKVLLSRPVLAWALYDWANSAFATTVMAGFFPIFYSTLSQDLTIKESQFWFNVTLAVSSIAIAIAAPILGAIADSGGGRRKFLATFAMLGIIMAAGLAWVQAGMWWLGLLFYGLGKMGFAGANIFYDAMLLDVAEEEDLDLVSGYGYALGYVGGGLLFAVNVLMVLNPGWFGLPDAATAVSASFISVAIWWAAFSIPLFISTRGGTATRSDLSGMGLIKKGFAELFETFREIRQFKMLLLFLVGYWLYIDGVGTIIKTAVFFGSRVLELPRESLITALLLTQFVAFPAALFFGWLGKKIGPKAGILIGLAVYFGVIIYAWKWLHTGADFYNLAIAIGLVQGGVQSLSRSLYARLIPKSRATEFFGFYNMVGKFASILGPLLMTLVVIIIPGATERDSILALLLLFGVGGFLVWRVDIERGMSTAARHDQ